MSDPEKTDYEVGYGKPPKEHQFKKGQSGRRRKRADETMAEMVLRVTGEPIVMNIDGKRKKVTMAEAALYKTINNCLHKGDIRALDRLLKVMADAGILPREILAEEARRGSEMVLEKIFNTFDRMVPDDPDPA